MRFPVLALLLSSCSSGIFSYQSPGNYEGGAILGNGTYFLEVWIEEEGRAPLRFNSVFARRPGDTLFSAVAPSGKSFFRVRDFWRAEDPEMKIFPTELEISKKILADFYSSFRQMLILTDKPPELKPPVKERFRDGRPRRLGDRLMIEEYDWYGHVFRFKIQGESWSAKGALREYNMKQ